MLENGNGRKELSAFKTKLVTGKKGFTLIEMVAVLAIIGMFTAVLVPNVGAVLSRSDATKEKLLLSTVNSALKVYKLEKGEYPVTLGQLVDAKLVPEGKYDKYDYSKDKGVATLKNGTVKANV